MKRLVLAIGIGLLVAWSSNVICAQDDAGPPPGPQPWKLPQPCCLQSMGIDVGGWIQQGISFNNWGSSNEFNGPISTNDLNSQYQLNQLWLYMVRPTKTDGCGVDIGGRVDVVYGTDWRFGQCVGLEPRIDSANSFYGLILPQFYLEVAVNDLTVKMGHYATFTALEVVPAPLNFFYSHSYIMSGAFDPLLVTGVQADYKLNDNWTAVGGFNRGWEMFEDPSDTLNFLGGFKWASDNKRTALSVMVDAGRQISFPVFKDVSPVRDRTSVYTVFTHQFNERLQYGSEYVVGIEPNGSSIVAGDNAEWFGTEHILTYKLNAQWSAAIRYEVVRDDDGARVAGIGNLLQINDPTSTKGWLGAPGFAGTFQDLSLGLNYRPHPNFVLRPEVRWDWYNGPANIAGQLPFDNFTKSHQFMFAVDLITTF